MAGSLPLLRSSVSCLLYRIALFEKGCVTFLFQKWTVTLPTGPSVTQVSLSPWGHPPGPSLPSLTLLINRVPEVLTSSLASCRTVTVTQDHLTSFWVLYLGSVGRTLRLTQEGFFTGINLKRLKMCHLTYPSFPDCSYVPRIPHSAMLVLRVTPSGWYIRITAVMVKLLVLTKEGVD